jgi:acyl-CoA thioesterase FadM
MNFHNKTYQIRISDINYGNHLGHDKLISIVHDARCSFFDSIGTSELHINDDQIGLVVHEVNFKYKSQIHFLDKIEVLSYFTEISDYSVKMNSEVKNMKQNKMSAVGYIKLVCYNFKDNKISKFPKEFVEKLQEFSH